MAVRQVIVGLMALPSLFAVVTTVVDREPDPVGSVAGTYCNAGYDSSDETVAPLDPEAWPYRGSGPHRVYTEWVLDIGSPAVTPEGTPVPDYYDEGGYTDRAQVLLCGYLLEVAGPGSVPCGGPAVFGLEFREARTGDLITRFTANGKVDTREDCADEEDPSGRVVRPAHEAIAPDDPQVAARILDVVDAKV